MAGSSGTPRTFLQISASAEAGRSGNRWRPSLLCVLWLGMLVTCALPNTLDSIYHQSYARKFILHEPKGYNGTDILPVMMVLHGGTGSAEGTINFTQMDKVADTAGFLAVFPQGYATSGKGFNWADGRSGKADSMGIDDVGFLSALIDTLKRRMSIDTSRIYVTGISNGAFMTNRLACELSQRIAAIAPVCATLDVDYFTHCAPARKVPILMIMGTKDPFVPYSGGLMSSSGRNIISADTMISFWRKNNACTAAIDSFSFPNIVLDDSSNVTRYVYGHCGCNATVSLYKITGGGHTWPGVEIKTYELVAGQTNMDIYASGEIWNFCKSHSLGCQSANIDHRYISGRQGLFSNSRETSTLVPVYSPMGRLLARFELSPLTGAVMLRQLPAGMYLLSTEGRAERVHIRP